jgi:hypothetical protein
VGRAGEYSQFPSGKEVGYNEKSHDLWINRRFVISYDLV